jgi:hypothetical protein
MWDGQSTGPPVVQVSAEARAELGAGQALVFDWTRLALCCAVAGEVSLRRTITSEVQGSAAFVPLRTADGGPPVFAHRRAYPLLVGRHIQVHCRRRLGMRSFTSSLPPDLGLRASFGRAARPTHDHMTEGRTFRA